MIVVYNANGLDCVRGSAYNYQFGGFCKPIPDYVPIHRVSIPPGVAPVSELLLLQLTTTAVLVGQQGDLEDGWAPRSEIYSAEARKY